MSVVVCVARKLRLCPSYSRRRDCINLVLWRSLYKGEGVVLLWKVHATHTAVQALFISKEEEEGHKFMSKLLLLDILW